MSVGGGEPSKRERNDKRGGTQESMRMGFVLTIMMSRDNNNFNKKGTVSIVSYFILSADAKRSLKSTTQTVGEGLMPAPDASS